MSAADQKVKQARAYDLVAAINQNDVVSVLRWLRSGIDPNATHCITGQTPLMLAAHSSSIDIVQELLKAGANVNAADNRSGKTVLMFALTSNYKDRYDIIKAVIDYKCNINATNFSGMTAADFLIHNSQGDSRILSLLMANGCRLEYHKDCSNFRVTQYCLTALWRSCYDAEFDPAYQSNITESKFLIERFLDSSICPSGETALMLASWLLYLSIQKEEDEKPVYLIECIAETLALIVTRLRQRHMLDETLNTPCFETCLSSEFYTTQHMRGHTPAEMITDCIELFHHKYSVVETGSCYLQTPLRILYNIITLCIESGAHIDTNCIVKVCKERSDSSSSHMDKLPKEMELMCRPLALQCLCAHTISLDNRWKTVLPLSLRQFIQFHVGTQTRTAK